MLINSYSFFFFFLGKLNQSLFKAHSQTRLPGMPILSSVHIAQYPKSFLCEIRSPHQASLRFSIARAAVVMHALDALVTAAFDPI